MRDAEGLERRWRDSQDSVLKNFKVLVGGSKIIWGETGEIAVCILLCPG